MFSIYIYYTQDVLYLTPRSRKHIFMEECLILSKSITQIKWESNMGSLSKQNESKPLSYGDSNVKIAYIET